MFCALLGQDIRRVFTGPLVLWFYYSLFCVEHVSAPVRDLGSSDFRIHA